MISEIDFFLNRQLEILIYIFSILSSILLITSLFKKEDKKLLKIGGLFFIAAVLLYADNIWIYLLSIFIIGSIVTGKNYLLDLIREWRTETRKDYFFFAPQITSKSIKPINTEVKVE